MRIKKLAAGFLSLLLIAGTFTGCGRKGLSSEAVADHYAETGWEMPAAAERKMEAAEEAVVYDMEEPAAGAKPVDAAMSENDKNSLQAAERKLIRNMNMSLETMDFEGLLTEIEQKVAELGGYVESSNVNGTPDSGCRSAYMNARVPSEKLDSFSDILGNSAVVISRSTNVQDVTLSYSDLEAHISALRVEQETLTEMLAKADDVSTVITIQNELTNIRYELESYESQMRIMQNQISYSSVFLDIREVRLPSTQEKDSIGERIRKTFRNSISGLKDSIADFVVFFIGNIVGIVFFVVVAAGCIWLLRAFFRWFFGKSKNRKPGKLPRKERENAKKAEAAGEVRPSADEQPVYTEVKAADEDSCK